MTRTTFTAVVLYIVLSLASIILGSPVHPRGIVPGAYIVTLTPGTNLESHLTAVSSARSIRVPKTHKFQFGNFLGYTATFSSADLQLVKSLPGVRTLCPSIAVAARLTN
jgi:hypothetical protein